MLGSPFLAGPAVGLAVACALFSTITAWHLGRPPWLDGALDPSHLIYNPLAVLWWIWRSGWHPVISDAAATAGIVWLMVSGLVMSAWGAELRPGKRPKDEGLDGLDAMLSEGVASFQPNGIVLGLHRGKIAYLNADGVNVLIGPSRGGKGVRHVVGTLLTWRRSAFVFDPKGDLYGIVGRFRESLGPTYVIDPTKDDPALARINVLQFIRKDHALQDCRNQAQMLAFPRGEDMSSKDPVWDEAATNMLTAVIYYVWESDVPTLRHVAYWVREIANGKYPTSPNVVVQQLLNAHANREKKVKDSVNFTMESKLGFLLGDTVCKTTDKTTFDPNALMTDDRPVTLFLSIPPTEAETMRPLARLIINAVLTVNMRHERLTQDGREKVRDSLLLLDEFPQLGAMDILEKRLGIMASYGFKPLLVCQAVEQIYKAYGPHQSITGLSNGLILIPRHSSESNKLAAEIAGDVWIKQKSLNKSSKEGAIGRSISRGESENRIPILNPATMRRRGRKESLILADGMVAWIKAAPYYKQRVWRGLFDWPPRVQAPHPSPAQSRSAPAVRQP